MYIPLIDFLDAPRYQHFIGQFQLRMAANKNGIFFSHIFYYFLSKKRSLMYLKLDKGRGRSRYWV